MIDNLQEEERIVVDIRRGSGNVQNKMKKMVVVDLLCVCGVCLVLSPKKLVS